MGDTMDGAIKKPALVGTIRILRLPLSAILLLPEIDEEVFPIQQSHSLVRLLL